MNLDARSNGAVDLFKVIRESESPYKKIETDPLPRKIMVHRAMMYECEACGNIYQIWLEKGLEDKKQDDIDPKNHKPVPFCTICLCGGTMKHIAWNRDIMLDDYRPLEETENYFENTESENCGISHIRNGGISPFSEEIFKGLVELSDILGQNSELTLEPKKELFVESEDDDPYGLAGFSTTQLKAELRRRKDNYKREKNKKFF